MDAVAAHQAGFPHVVATLGTSLTDEHIRLLGRYTKNVVLSFDADDAGVRAALKAADLFAGAGNSDWTLRILALPPGEDPDSLLARGDAPAFHKAIESALTVPEFRLQVLQARYDPSNEQDKQAFIREALPILADVSSHIERDKIIHRLARYHHNYATAGSARAQESLRDEFREYLSRSGREPTMPPLDAPPRADAQPVRLRGETVLPPGRRPGGHTGFRPQETFTRSGGQRRWVPTNNMPEPPPAAPRRTAADVAERTLLRALLSDEWTQAVRGRVTPEDFPDAETVRLVDALLPLIEGGIAPSEALRELSDAVLADHANALLLAPDDDAPLSEPLITDCLYALEMRRRRGEIGEIRAQAAPDPEGKRDGDDELLRRWEQKARAMKAPRPADHGG
jgi:DNA primase